ncbi:MAG TPA: PspC domain-containing protein [Candidatus Hydrogenedens sp.]|nr:PspC domain-containing protein [Candidatus Hydrogenedens sp.]
MILTQRQANIIDNYLSEVDKALGASIGENYKKEILAKLKERIYSALRQNERSYINDEELIRILEEQFDTPEVQARKIIHPKDAKKVLILNRDGGIWLGVCSGISLRSKLPVLFIRLLFVMLGIILGIGLFLYIAFYFWLYFRSGIYRGTSVQRGFFIWQIFLTILILMAVFGCSVLILKGIEYIHYNYVSHLSEKSRLLYDAYNYNIMICLCFCWTCLLCGCMGGLPLKNEWDKTFRNLRDAQIALFVFLEFIFIVSLCVWLIVDAVDVIRDIVI